MALILVTFAVPLVVAAVSDAALTWDGAYYLFRTLDNGKPFIAHDRLIDAPLHWPVLWVGKLTDSMGALRLTFGAIHVVTPLLSIALSWWVVRKDAPALIIWPIIGIGLATLPGQINFISEGIKAHQLIWPVLLSVLIGLPPRTVPLAAMTSLAIMYLHPAAVPIFVATAGASLATAWLRPQDRERLVPLAVCLAIAALLRYGMISGGYESGEMNMETMKRQWRGSATGLPGLAIAATFTLGAVLLWNRSRTRRATWWTTIAVGLVAIAAGVLTVWAADTTRWWAALQFRGPVLVTSLTIAGCAFVDATLDRLTPRGRTLGIPLLRRRAAQAVAVTFAIVLSIQSVQYGRLIDDMNETLDAAGAACVDLSSLSGMPESPLNLWSTPALSLLYRGWSPDRVVLMDGDCERARATGALAISAPGTTYDSTRIDLVPLEWDLGGHNSCWWDEPEGWYSPEVTDAGRRRWSADEGVIRVFVGEPTEISLRGEIVSFTPDNIVTVSVNGVPQTSIELRTTHHKPLDGITLELAYGQNEIRLGSANESGRAPGDPRDLAFSLLNVEPVPASGGSCSYRP